MSDPRTGPWARTTLAAAIGALLAVLAAASPAQAHNQFVGSTPETGATVTEAPMAITLEFTEAIDDRFTELAVTGPDGQAIEIGEPSASGDTLTAEAEFTASGEHTIGYRVMSNDGHPVEGEIVFTVDLPAEPTPSNSPSTPSEPASSQPADATGWLPTALLIGGIALIGALALILPRRR